MDHVKKMDCRANGEVLLGRQETVATQFLSKAFSFHKNGFPMVRSQLRKEASCSMNRRLINSTP